MTIDVIAQKNTEFKQTLTTGANPFPKVRLFKPGESVMSKYAIAKPQSKLQRVVANTEEVEEMLEEGENNFVLSSGISG